MIQNSKKTGKNRIRAGAVSLLMALMLILPAIPASAAEVSEDNSNYDYTFQNIDGGTISTQSGGSCKMLVFFSRTCSNCQNVLGRLSNSSWVQDGSLAEVCAVECNGGTIQTDVENFRNTYCPNAGSMQFGYGFSAYDAWNAYMNLVPSAGTLPLIVLVDADNNICQITNGPSADSGIEQKLEDLNNNSGSNPSNPGDSGSQNPGDSGSQNPDGSQKPNDTVEGAKKEKTESSSASGSSCDHVEETVSVNDATTGSDAVAMTRCIKCGAILRYEEVPNSAYAVFLKETANSILTAKQTTVVVSTETWVSFDKRVFDAMKQCPNVTLTVNYVYNGTPYVLEIPAGTNVDLLMDENGFGDFRYIEQVLNGNV